MMLKHSLIAVFASSLLVACGGGDGGGSGVDGSTILTDLSDAEIIEICEYSEGLIDDTHLDEVSCYIEGVFAAQQGGDCQAVADECIGMIMPEPSDCSDAANESLPECAAMVTVGEMENCLRAQASQLNGVDVDCNTTPEELNDLFEQELPAACAAIDMKCPDLFGDDEV